MLGSPAKSGFGLQTGSYRGYVRGAQTQSRAMSMAINSKLKMSTWDNQNHQQAEVISLGDSRSRPLYNPDLTPCDFHAFVSWQDSDSRKTMKR
ncbi:hypothetical protein TNCV_1309451 [Trichonephila clavipes]|nr:hypothetical protein TNCV_1309451 [Trichonephila clavipes]